MNEIKPYSKKQAIRSVTRGRILDFLNSKLKIDVWVILFFVLPYLGITTILAQKYLFSPKIQYMNRVERIDKLELWKTNSPKYMDLVITTIVVDSVLNATKTQVIETLVHQQDTQSIIMGEARKIPEWQGKFVKTDL